MKKIGIITYQNTTNYGALLQAFALQSKLKELGANCETINYHCKNIEERENVSFPKFKNNFIEFLRRIKVYYKVSKKRNVMKNFINKNLKLSRKHYTKKNIKQSNKIYDKFIVGSDMVFELGINGGDMTFYLDFAEPKKRYSYAASLGVEKIDDKYKKRCIEELEKFEHISIREEQGKEYFSKILKNEVYQDIDPTLLYDGKFWERFEEIPKEKNNKRYILLYFVDEKSQEFRIAKKIAEKNDLNLYLLSNEKKIINGCKVIHNASVGEFLYYIHNASLVMTESYHGMLFSINYNTSFMYFCHKKDTSRLDNIAQITKLTDRKLTSDTIPDLNCNFSEANEILKSLRKKSIEYLKSIL